MAKKLSKKELINLLVESYGYDESDIKMFTNAKLEGMIKQEEADAEALEVEETVIIAKDKGFKDDDLIIVMNGLYSPLTHRSSSSGRIWKFSGFGQTQKIPYSEILSIRNIASVVFDEGWLIILNRQIQKDLGLIELYKNIITPENIDEIFNKSSDDLEAFIDSLPKGMKVTFISKARDLYNDKKIDSVRTIKMIENKFGISLDDNAPLSDIV
jgi:hypothetical protein